MIKVVDWMDYDAITDDMKESIGGTGGWFNATWSGRGPGQRWKDYITTWDESVWPYLEGLRAEVLAQQLRLTGEQHQISEKGVPVFEDGTYAEFSWRGWGDLMAAIWSEAEDKDYHYMDFYM